MYKRALGVFGLLCFAVGVIQMVHDWPLMYPGNISGGFLTLLDFFQWAWLVSTALALLMMIFKVKDTRVASIISTVFWFLLFIPSVIYALSISGTPSNLSWVQTISYSMLYFLVPGTIMSYLEKES